MAAWPTVSVRPHVKAHKTAELAQMQLQLLGCQGVCAQKVAEAEAMAEGGVVDILLSNEVVAARKIERLVGLASLGRFFK
jgi:3-hydroxy-D-aspartate aldolase